MTNQDFPDVVGWMLNHSKEIIFREVVRHENVVVLSIGGGIAHTSEGPSNLLYHCLLTYPWCLHWIQTQFTHSFASAWVDMVRG